MAKAFTFGDGLGMQEVPVSDVQARQGTLQQFYVLNLVARTAYTGNVELNFEKDGVIDPSLFRTG